RLELQLAAAYLATPFHERVALAEFLRVLERTIAVRDLHGDQRAIVLVVANLRARHAHQAAVVLAEALRPGERGAARDPHGGARDAVERLQLHRARGV